ncbi:MAG: hypothetical protein ACN4GZ_03515 [Acidimicrobiales bacterium]
MVVRALSGVLVCAGVALAPVGLRTPAAARSNCSAYGVSDGVTAEAIATCSVPPDGLILNPLECQHVSYGLVVADDTTTAVFPDRVIKDHQVSAEPIDSTDAEGFENHFGTVVDVLTPGGSRVAGMAVYSELGQRRFSATGRWWNRTCWEPGLHTDGLKPGATDGPFPEGPEVPLSELVALARAKVDPPPVPPVVHAGPSSLVQLPSWFWVQEDWWALPHRGHHSHGLMTVSVTALPSRWRLSLAGTDAVLVECAGRGVTWRRGAQDELGCTHVFAEPAIGGSVSLRLVVEMETSWTSSVVGYGVQPLDPIYRMALSDLPLIEVAGLRSASVAAPA